MYIKNIQPSEAVFNANQKDLLSSKKTNAFIEISKD